MTLVRIVQFIGNFKIAPLSVTKGGFFIFMKLKLKAQIVEVGPELKSFSVKENTIKRILTIIEIPENNPYGKDYNNQISFEIEVHNDNLRKFGIHENIVNGEMAFIELIIYPFKKDNNSKTEFKFMLNDFILSDKLE